MPRPLSKPIPIPLPSDLDPSKLPHTGTAELCAEIHLRHYGPISRRTIRERWGLPWRIVNGRGVTEIPVFLAEARRRFDAAPVVVGGQGEAARYQPAPLASHQSPPDRK
jgi:hypothetical protein